MEGGTAGLAADVSRGALHVALCFQDGAAPRREHVGTARLDLGAEPMHAALPADHPLAGRDRVRLGEVTEGQGEMLTMAGEGAERGVLTMEVPSGSYRASIEVLHPALGRAGLVRNGFTVPAVPPVMAETSIDGGLLPYALKATTL